MARSTHRRRGLTLIELLVVISIVVTLLAIVAAVAPRLGERQRASQGASQLQAWLNIAKQRAIRSLADVSPRPSGVRLIPPTGPSTAQYVTECQYVETPPDFTGGIIQIPFSSSNPSYRLVRLSGVDLPLSGNVAVQPGDVIEFYELFPGQPRQIVAIAPAATGGGIQITLDAEVGGPFLDSNRKPTYTNPISKKAEFPAAPPPQTGAYRIIRQPRPVPGEAVLQFPQGVGIDISCDQFPPQNWYRTYPRFNTGGGSPLEIVFDPSGRVVSPIGYDSSRVCLWVRDITKDFPTGAMPDGDNTLVTIYTRTGQVAAHPVDASGVIPGPSWDPFKLTRDGRSSGQ